MLDTNDTGTVFICHLEQLLAPHKTPNLEDNGFVFKRLFYATLEPNAMCCMALTLTSHRRPVQYQCSHQSLPVEHAGLQLLPSVLCS
jgi:hypothetical protein